MWNAPPPNDCTQLKGVEGGEQLHKVNEISCKALLPRVPDFEFQNKPQNGWESVNQIYLFQPTVLSLNHLWEFVLRSQYEIRNQPNRGPPAPKAMTFWCPVQGGNATSHSKILNDSLTMHALINFHLWKWACWGRDANFNWKWQGWQGRLNCNLASPSMRGILLIRRLHTYKLATEPI